MRSQLRDVERRLALAELLTRPDPTDLHRGSKPLIEGDADRYRLVPYFTAAYIQTKLLEWQAREEAAVTVIATLTKPLPKDPSAE